jgi:hypothetical protein
MLGWSLSDVSPGVGDEPAPIVVSTTLQNEGTILGSGGCDTCVFTRRHTFGVGAMGVGWLAHGVVASGEPSAISRTGTRRR